MPKTVVEQFAVTCARDLAIRLVDTFHEGTAEEKNNARKAYLSMTHEMFTDGVKGVDQCRELLTSMLEGLNTGTWPEDDGSFQQANQIGVKLRG